MQCESTSLTPNLVLFPAIGLGVWNSEILFAFVIVWCLSSSSSLTPPRFINLLTSSLKAHSICWYLWMGLLKVRECFLALSRCLCEKKISRFISKWQVVLVCSRDIAVAVWLLLAARWQAYRHSMPEPFTKAKGREPATPTTTIVRLQLPNEHANLPRPSLIKMPLGLWLMMIISRLSLLQCNLMLKIWSTTNDNH